MKVVYADHQRLIAEIGEREKPPAAISASKSKAAVRPVSKSGQQAVVRIRQTGVGSIAAPGTVAGAITTNAPCSVVQNGGTNNSASPICAQTSLLPNSRYACDGTETYITTQSALDVRADFRDGFNKDYQAMRSMLDDHDFKGLLSKCSVEVSLHKEWPTPLLFCAIASAEIEQKTAASSAFKAYESRKSLLTDVGPSTCDALEATLKRRHPLVVDVAAE